MKVIFFVAMFAAVMFSAILVSNAICPNKPIVTYSFGPGRGYWAELRTVDGSNYNMHRGPYWFEWMARNAFPIQRWTFKSMY